MRGIREASHGQGLSKKVIGVQRERSLYGMGMLEREEQR